MFMKSGKNISQPDKACHTSHKRLSFEIPPGPICPNAFRSLTEL